MTGFLITPSGIANTQIHLDKTIANTFIEVQTRSGEIGLVAIEKGMDGKSALEIANAASSRRAHSLAVRRMSKSIKGTYVWYSGGTYFFTVNCLQRNNNDLLIRHIDHLKRAFQQ
jgi:hypothetical protein